jgi:hypothetical protein
MIFTHRAADWLSHDPTTNEQQEIDTSYARRRDQARASDPEAAAKEIARPSPASCCGSPELPQARHEDHHSSPNGDTFATRVHAPSRFS